MTLYVLLTALGALTYTGVAHAERAVAGFDGTHVAFGLQFAFFVSLSASLAAVVVFYANRLLRAHSSSLGRVPGWRERVFIVALVCLAGSVAVLIATTRERGGASSCAGQCGAGHEAVTAEASITSPSGSRAVVVPPVPIIRETTSRGRLV